jgi:hypothetical protein
VSIVSVRLVALLSVSLAVVSCGAAAGASPSPSTSAATADPAAAARCEQLQERKVTPCPPANLALERIGIRNGTNGAVPDPVARDEGIAYLRVHALYDWAMRQPDGDTFLLSGAVVPPEIGRTNIYRSEAQIFADARTAGGQAHVQTLTTTIVTLVAVPAAVQASAQRDGLTPSAYAWVDNQSGPGRAWITAPNGATRQEVDIPSGQPHPILVFGQVRDDPLLGRLWYEGGEYGCLSSLQVREVCGV